MAKNINGVQALIDHLRLTGTGNEKLDIAAEQLKAGECMEPREAVRVAIDHMKARGVNPITIGKAETFYGDYPNPEREKALREQANADAALRAGTAARPAVAPAPLPGAVVHPAGTTVPAAQPAPGETVVHPAGTTADANRSARGGK